ncbi:MAG TPA: DedA family protein [Streptosporangiaceae bacterium]|jgi:membrane protein DedA with SNARE-associated domain
MQSLLTHAGYGALILFGFLQACCVPIPSEITFGFAGVLAFQGHLNLVLVIVIGSIAELGGSYLSYAVGRIGGRPLIERLGRFVLVTRSDIARAESFMAGRGAWVVAVGRALPVIRAFTSLVAGLVELPPVQFGVLSLLGTLVYATVIAVIGYQVGSAWNSFNHYFSVGTYILVGLAVLVIAAFILYRLRSVRKEAASERAAGGDPMRSGRKG